MLNKTVIIDGVGNNRVNILAQILFFMEFGWTFTLIDSANNFGEEKAALLCNALGLEC